MPAKRKYLRTAVVAALPETISPALIRHLRKCSINPKLKAGMTASEAADAMDAAVQRFVDCLAGP